MFGISAYAQAPFASLGENTVVVALTGVVATGAVGTVEVAKAFALTGVEATGAVGSVTVEITVAITGVSATGSVGTVVQSSSVELVFYPTQTLVL